MRTRIILIMMLIALLALPMAVQAQEGDPPEDVVVNDQEGDPAGDVVVSESAAAVNTGNVQVAKDSIATTASVTVPAATVSDSAAPAPAEGDSDSGDGDGDEDAAAAAAAADPAATQQYTGSEEIEAWLEGQVSANAQINLEQCSVAGQTVTCAVNYTSDALRARGIDSLQGELATTVAEGKIQSFDFNPSAESVSKIQSAFAAPRTLPQSGGETPDTNYTMVLVAMLLLLLAGAGVVTYAFQRRGA